MTTLFKASELELLSAEEIFDNVAKGNFLLVEGKVNLFQGRKQFIISRIEKLSPSEVNEDDFIMKATALPSNAVFL